MYIALILCARLMQKVVPQSIDLWRMNINKHQNFQNLICNKI